MCFVCLRKSRKKIHKLAWFFFHAQFKTWWFKISTAHICLFFPPESLVLLHQWASFMLLYGLCSGLHKCIYPTLGETASSCFILTWTLNLSLYIVCIRLNFGLCSPPPVLLVMNNTRLASFLSTAVSLYCCYRSPPVFPVWDGLWPQWKSNRG